MRTYVPVSLRPRADGLQQGNQIAQMAVPLAMRESDLIANEPLGVGALSYAGAFGIGVVADRDAYPDLDVFVAGAREELDTLGVSTHPMPALRELSHDNHADP